MIEINKYSGIAYVTTGNFKQSTDGKEFIKCGNIWVDDDGHMVEEEENEFRNLTTGINSTFGDPFAEVE